MLFEMPAGLDPLPIPPNDDILLPDDDLPPPPVQKPKAKRKRKEIKFLTEDELARLFSVIPSVRDRAMFQIAYRAGLRASEVGLLQLRDYDPKADRIFIHRLKGSNSGHHHLMREEARALPPGLPARFPLGCWGTSHRVKSTASKFAVQSDFIRVYPSGRMI